MDQSGKGGTCSQEPLLEAGSKNLCLIESLGKREFKVVTRILA